MGIAPLAALPMSIMSSDHRVTTIKERKNQEKFAKNALKSQLLFTENSGALSIKTAIFAFMKMGETQ